jgi:ATP-dependent DNA helicase DinG
LRKQDDKGVFVILDRQMPTRLTSCFPPDITVERCGIAETISAVRAFLGD